MRGARPARASGGGARVKRHPRSRQFFRKPLIFVCYQPAFTEQVTRLWHEHSPHTAALSLFAPIGTPKAIAAALPSPHLRGPFPSRLVTFPPLLLSHVRCASLHDKLDFLVQDCYESPDPASPRAYPVAARPKPADPWAASPEAVDQVAASAAASRRRVRATTSCATSAARYQLPQDDLDALVYVSSSNVDSLMDELDR